MTSFSAMQAEYAAHGVAVYPVGEDKVPLIRSFQKIGAPASEQLALKFGQAKAAGFCAGHRNRLTLADIDSTDEKLVDYIDQRFGRSPLVVQTPSGGFHAYYRHSGEKRRIRAIPDVDILGEGHCVAAGSEVAKGTYKIIRGTLADLDRLPPIRSDLDFAGTSCLKPVGRIPWHERNKALFKYCRATAEHCDNLEQLIDAASTWADQRLEKVSEDPFTNVEIVKTCRSAWRYKGGRKNMIVAGPFLEAPQFNALAADTRALALFGYLSMTQGEGAQFLLADGLADHLGWSRRSIPSARQTLLELGIIKCVRPAKRGAPALYRWNVPHD